MARVVQNVLMVMVALFLCAADYYVKDKSYYYINPDKAMAMLKGRCKGYTPTSDVFVKMPECQAVVDAVKETLKVKEYDLLQQKLTQFKGRISDSVDAGVVKSDRYKVAYDGFEVDVKHTEDVIGVCMEGDLRIDQNGVECMAAVDVTLERLAKDKSDNDKRLGREINYKEYYRQYYREHPEEATKILEGRCKKVFANRWYEYDLEVQDHECNMARSEARNHERQEKADVLEEQQKEYKGISYYREHLQEGKAVIDECRSGIIKDLDACEMTLQVEKETQKDEKKRIEFQEYFKKHIFAAKFHLRWCKSAMLEFDTKCQVASDILANHKDRVIDPVKLKDYQTFFKANPFEAKLAVVGKCHDRLTDPWYYLDVNLQTEECGAAAEVAR